MGGGGSSETGPVMKKKDEKCTTSIGASLTPDNRDKEESNNISGLFRGYWAITLGLILTYFRMSPVVPPHSSISAWTVVSGP